MRVLHGEGKREKRELTREQCGRGWAYVASFEDERVQDDEGWPL